MKLKSQPTDFQVVELSNVQPTGGPHALYELTKTSLGTPEAIAAILQHWNLPRNRVSYGGMKDRHARSTQKITIYQGPQRDLRERSFSLKYLGQFSKPFDASNIGGNQFQIRLRGIQPDQQEAITTRAQTVSRLGVVNYFDDQRFGSLGRSGRFIAEPWCKGDYEQALHLALAEPNTHDRPREAEQKSLLREHWGNWLECKNRLDRSHRRSIVTYLVDHPTGFKRAIALLRSDLRSIYVAAFQSGLWNRWLSRLIEERCQPTLAWLPSPVGSLALPLSVEEDADRLKWLKELSLPLPSARQHDWPGELVGSLDAILSEYGLARNEIRLKYPRDTFFSKGSRACWLRADDFRFEWEEDDLHRGRVAILLRFSLPRGAYATMIVKMLQGAE